MKKIICISEGSDGVDFARLITNEFATTGAMYTCGGFISETDATVGRVEGLIDSAMNCSTDFVILDKIPMRAFESLKANERLLLISVGKYCSNASLSVVGKDLSIPEEAAKEIVEIVNPTDQQGSVLEHVNKLKKSLSIDSKESLLHEIDVTLVSLLGLRDSVIQALSSKKMSGVSTMDLFD